MVSGAVVSVTMGTCVKNFYKVITMFVITSKMKSGTWSYKKWKGWVVLFDSINWIYQRQSRKVQTDAPSTDVHNPFIVVTTPEFRHPHDVFVSIFTGHVTLCTSQWCLISCISRILHMDTCDSVRMSGLFCKKEVNVIEYFLFPFCWEKLCFCFFVLFR